MFRRKVKVNPEYRAIHTGTMKHWGYNAFWLSEGKMCIFGIRPNVGDVVVSYEQYHVVENVITNANPGDQHFVTLRKLKKPPPPSKRKPSWTDGLV